MFANYRHFALLIGLLLGVPLPAWGINPVSWQVALSTTGDDVFWTSPTALTAGVAEYDWSYEITELTANVLLLGDQDLLGLIGDDTAGGGTEMGLPFLVANEMFSDATTGSSATIRIEVDAAGVGHGSATDMILGSFLGLPIRRVDFKANVTILGVPTGDYDRDGDVDAADYGAWRANFSSTTSLKADGNNNNHIDAADYVVWRNNLGSGASTEQLVGIPEPSSLLLLAAAGFAIAALRPRRRWLA